MDINFNVNGIYPFIFHRIKNHFAVKKGEYTKGCKEKHIIRIQRKGKRFKKILIANDYN
jgi:hypothetical protein